MLPGRGLTGFERSSAGIGQRPSPLVGGVAGLLRRAEGRLDLRSHGVVRRELDVRLTVGTGGRGRLAHAGRSTRSAAGYNAVRSTAETDGRLAAHLPAPRRCAPLGSATVPPSPSPLPSALADVLTPTVRALRRLYAAESVSIALTSADGSTLRFVVADGRASDNVVGLELPTGTGIAGWVAMSQQQMAVADVTRDPRFARDVAESIGYVPTAILAAPLPGEDGALGVIEVLDPDPARRGDLGTLSLAGSLLAAVATLAEQHAAAPVDPSLAHGLARLAAHGPAATDLAARLLAAVADTWDARG